MATASVIIPTHGRPEKLERCIEAIGRQRLASGDSLEVIVAIDGAICGDDTAVVETTDRIIRIRLPRVGVSAARNAAIELARGEFLLFVNDDCYPDIDWAGLHIAAQRRRETPAMIVGRTDWMPWPDMTVFDGLVRDTSMVFFYNTMCDGERYGFRHFWTCNASIPRTVAFDVGGFDERIRPYLFDDVEFAWRVEHRIGGGVHYEASAHCVHDHRVSWDDYLARERCLGRMAACLADVNRPCFSEIFGYDDPHRMRDEFATWLDMGAGDHERIAKELAGRMSERLPDQKAWSELRELLYAAHLPVKRRFFRQAFVESVDASVPDRAMAPMH